MGGLGNQRVSTNQMDISHSIGKGLGLTMPLSAIEYVYFRKCIFQAALMALLNF